VVDHKNILNLFMELQRKTKGLSAIFKDVLHKIKIKHKNDTNKPRTLDVLLSTSCQYIRKWPKKLENVRFYDYVYRSVISPISYRAKFATR
jgi:hypothetical protein